MARAIETSCFFRNLTMKLAALCLVVVAVVSLAESNPIPEPQFFNNNLAVAKTAFIKGALVASALNGGFNNNGFNNNGFNNNFNNNRRFNRRRNRFNRRNRNRNNGISEYRATTTAATLL